MTVHSIGSILRKQCLGIFNKRIEKAKKAEEADKLKETDKLKDIDRLELMLNASSVPSLQNLTLSKIVIPLITEELMYITSLYSKRLEKWPLVWPVQFQYVCERVRRKVTEDIRKLNVSWASLEEKIFNRSLEFKLKKFIATLCCRVEEWLKTYYSNLLRKDDTYFIIMNNIPHCWLAHGTIALEKSIQLIFRNNDILPTNRFIYACKYCCYEDILNLWELLPETQKAHLRITSDFIVRSWIEWLESYFNKDWQFCVAWILGTPLWNKNIFVLKRVLGALTPKERNYYLRKTLIQRDVSSNVMQFCRSLVTIDEQLQNLRESPFKSI